MQTSIRTILNKISGFHQVPNRFRLLPFSFHTSGPDSKRKKSPDKDSPTEDNNNVNTEKDLDPTMVIRVLNVAEKNDAAKTISALLSNGNARRVNISYLNKINRVRNPGLRIENRDCGE